MKFRNSLPLLLALSLALGFLSYFSYARLVAGDEAFYLMAGRLVYEGKLLYLDFFFPQMPGHPYFLGALYSWTGPNYQASRWLSVFCALIFLASFGKYIWRHFGVYTAAISVILLTVSTIFAPWMVIAKTYSLSLLLLWLCFVAYEEKRLGWAGFWAGIAMVARFPMVVAVPCILLHLFLSSGRRDFIAGLSKFSLGFILGFSPAIFFFILSPEIFLYSNFGFHSNRFVVPEVNAYENRVRVIQRLFGWSAVGQYAPDIFPLFFVLSFGHFVASLWNRKSPSLSLFFAGALFLFHFIPRQINLQYFCSVLPFLIIPGLIFLSDYKPKKVLLSLSLMTLGFFCYFWSWSQVVITYNNFMIYGENIPGSNGNPLPWRMSFIKDVKEALKANIPPGEEVLALWPGHILESGHIIVPGFENQFGWQVAERNGGNYPKRMYLPTRLDAAAKVRSGEISNIVALKRDLSEQLIAAISEKALPLCWEQDGVVIYCRRHSSP